MLCFVPVLHGRVWYVCCYVRKKALLQCLCNYCQPVNPLILDSCRHARSRFQIYLDKTKKAETECIAQKKRKEIDAEPKYSKTKKQKLEVLVKQLCDEADTLSTDAEKKNKMSILVKANAIREKAKQKSKEVDVIAHDIEAAETKLHNM